MLFWGTLVIGAICFAFGYWYKGWVDVFNDDGESL